MNAAGKMAIVITSIASPVPVLCTIARECRNRGHQFIVVGDVASPPDFELEGCDFYGLARQSKTGFRFASMCPERHYARKNIGYLLAIQHGADLIVDTDDDNMPRDAFWEPRQRRQKVRALAGAGWVNVYQYFTAANIWPRGLPLDCVLKQAPPLDELPVSEIDAPIQQGLANENPDVDAIYRLVLPLPQSFSAEVRVALGPGTWSPFNSQNTTWWADAFPLLYLPAHCSFRMTDIWRSFVAQRIAWENDWAVLYHEATVWQERNEHNLMKDFADEIPGYLNNRRIAEELGKLPVKSGMEPLCDNVIMCYERLVAMQCVGREEIPLLTAWIEDLVSVLH